MMNLPLIRYSKCNTKAIESNCFCTYSKIVFTVCIVPCHDTFNDAIQQKIVNGDFL